MSSLNGLDHQIAPPVDLPDRRVPTIREGAGRLVAQTSHVHLVPAKVLGLDLGLETAEVAVELLPDELVVDRHGACVLLIERSATTRPARLTTPRLLALQALGRAALLLYRTPRRAAMACSSSLAVKKSRDVHDSCISLLVAYYEPFVVLAQFHQMEGLGPLSGAVVPRLAM